MDVITLEHFGPHDVKDVDHDMLRAVRFEGMPVIVRQTMPNGVTVCAVLARKDIKIACVGCFRHDMLITDTARCKKCSGFVKHMDMKHGVQRLKCKDDGEANHVMAPDAVEVRVPVTKDSILEELTDTELLDAVKSRQLGSCVVEEMNDEELAATVQTRGVEPLTDARPTKLMYKLRRQGDKRNVSVEAYYRDKVLPGGLPSGCDAVGADLSVVRGCEVVHETRRTKKKKTTEPTVRIIHFPPKAVGDCSQTAHRVAKTAMNHTKQL